VIFGGGTVIGGPVLGLLADRMGGRAPIVLGGIVCLAAAAFGYVASRHYGRPGPSGGLERSANVAQARPTR